MSPRCEVGVLSLSGSARLAAMRRGLALRAPGGHTVVQLPAENLLGPGDAPRRSFDAALVPHSPCARGGSEERSPGLDGSTQSQLLLAVRSSLNCARHRLFRVSCITWRGFRAEVLVKTGATDAAGRRLRSGNLLSPGAVVVTLQNQPPQPTPFRHN